MLVSVVVPFYNPNIQFFDECVKSIKSQTFKDFELVFIDDGSDKSGVIPKEGKFISFTENQGVVVAKNCAISIAEGKYVCVVDCDDMIEPTYLEECVKVLESNSRIAIAYTDFYHFGKKDNPIMFPDYDLNTLRKMNIMLGSAMFRKSSAMQAGLFSLEMKDGMEDYDLWMSILEGRYWIAKHIPKPLYRYRAHDDNRTNKMDMKTQYCRFWLRHGMPERCLEFPEVKIENGKIIC